MFESPATARPVFRSNPWATGYGSSFDLDENEELEEEGPRPTVTTVENAEWSFGITPTFSPRPQRIVFIDGAERRELDGTVETGDTVIPAALFSVAVGSSECLPTSASIENLRVERILALARESPIEPIDVRAGSIQLRFLPETPKRFSGETASAAAAIRNVVSTRRRALERHLAEELASEDGLVIMDGRLLFDPARGTPVIGLAKTIHEPYVTKEQFALVARLRSGERTPVFRIDYETSSRYSWFLRLPFTSRIHHSFAGIVRLETPEIGPDAAISLANVLSFHLPSFASKPEHDARAPQNLLPVGALERRLRHEMGDALFIRRVIESHLYKSEVL